jgi:hypothetical protein
MAYPQLSALETVSNPSTERAISALAKAGEGAPPTNKPVMRAVPSLQYTCYEIPCAEPKYFASVRHHTPLADRRFPHKWLALSWLAGNSCKVQRVCNVQSPDTHQLKSPESVMLALHMYKLMDFHKCVLAPPAPCVSALQLGACLYQLPYSSCFLHARDAVT